VACDLKIGQHMERMVALQQLEKLRICMTMHIRKLLKPICDLGQTMNDGVAAVKYATKSRPWVGFAQSSSTLPDKMA
jgi:hypothetical protein